MAPSVETREFQAQSRQLLDLMIHSIYTNKDSFLRELISNSSDALDKLRLAAFQDKDLDVDTSDLHIELIADPEARTLTVRDNGIGMSREEVVDLIGTLAKSGTGQLREALVAAKEAKDSDSPAAAEALIGQFGIGFYSTFMVADTVTLVSRKAGEDAGTKWQSHGEDTYTIEDVADAPQGTSVTLDLKPADDENHLFDYTSEQTLTGIIKRHSDFIAWPIRMEKTVPAPPPEEGEEPGEPTREVVTVNSQKALWTRPRSEVTDEEYAEFYRHVSHGWDSPLEVIPMKAEGTFEYQALLFIPSQAPFDLFQREHSRGVQLYVKRVFIMDDCEELMPEYLRFVKGVVDAQDLSLNVSREILQQDRQVRRIQKGLVRKVLATVAEMKDKRPDDYATFWEQFGRVLKEGLLSDADNQKKILEVSSFESTYTAAAQGDEEQGVEDQAGDGSDEYAPARTTLAGYIERAGADQDVVYYMTGESRQAVENSPHMEAFRAKGVEVLILTDPVDEVWVDAVQDFEGKRFQSIAKGEVDLDSEDERKAAEEEREKRSGEFAGLTGWMQELLSEDVKEVRLSTRLTESPACVVGDSFDITPQLEKMYRAMGQELPQMKRILEINPTHPLVTGLRAAHESRPDDAGLADTAHLVYGMAVLAEGGELSDPAAFAKLLGDKLSSAL
ncbi:molecular chaperone HtpG [Tomitella fengzijianii]|uniref:Chaperone protein HtpG n=1 Tax=Tomitella fengzijianii TaxID=2597660 RepID=A0A516X6C2_9ACTN|nr:molecular chaperone HtpG [Tomitella fengzijianii]QDQ98627.1 molecular chaperone HtpG [Tomitella fengzijianii]